MAPSGDDDSGSDATVVTVDDKTVPFISGLAVVVAMLSMLVVELTVVVAMLSVVVVELTVVVAMLSVVVVELTVVVAVGVVEKGLLHLCDAQHDRDVFTLSSGNWRSTASQSLSQLYRIAHISP